MSGSGPATTTAAAKLFFLQDLIIIPCSLSRFQQQQQHQKLIDNC